MIDTQKYCMARTSSWRGTERRTREPLVVYTARKARRGRPNVTLNGLDSPLETGQTTDASVTATATRDRGRRRHRFPDPAGLRAAAPTPDPLRARDRAGKRPINDSVIRDNVVRRVCRSTGSRARRRGRGCDVRSVANDYARTWYLSW